MSTLVLFGENKKDLNFFSIFSDFFESAMKMTREKEKKINFPCIASLNDLFSDLFLGLF